MSAQHTPVIDGESAVFTLATGEKVRVTIRETGLGMMGYRVNVNADKTLLVIPSSGNAIDLMTKRSLHAESAEADRVVCERNAARAAPTKAGSAS